MYLLSAYYVLSTVLGALDTFSSVQSLSRVRLFATPWIAACQASLSITNSQSSEPKRQKQTKIPAGVNLALHDSEVWSKDPEAQHHLKVCKKFGMCHPDLLTHLWPFNKPLSLILCMFKFETHFSSAPVFYFGVFSCFQMTSLSVYLLKTCLPMRL